MAGIVPNAPLTNAPRTNAPLSNRGRFPQGIIDARRLGIEYVRTAVPCPGFAPRRRAPARGRMPRSVLISRVRVLSRSLLRSWGVLGAARTRAERTAVSRGETTHKGNVVASEFGYDAFISYSRRDTAFARRLEKALRTYRPPRELAVPQRALKVFRDDAD